MKLVCDAALVDTSETFNSFMTEIPIIKKAKIEILFYKIL